MKPDDPIKGLKAKVHRSERTGLVQRIYTITDEFKGMDLLAVAKAFLRKYAVDLGLDPRLKGLVYEQVKKSMLGNHVMFQQFVDGKPVSGGWLRVDIADDGRLLGVHNNAVPQQRIERARPVRRPITAKAASTIAAHGISAGSIRTEAERVFWPVDGEPRDAWKVIVESDRPNGVWRV